MKNFRDFIYARQGLPSIKDQLIIIEKNRQEADKKREIDQLVSWFEGYDMQIAEHARCKRMGIDCKHNIIEMDIMAENKRSRLRELRK